MTIPSHRCTALCREEDGVHCVPDLLDAPGLVELDWWQQNFDVMGLEVLEVRREADVTVATWEAVDGGKNPKAENQFGYLVWVRERV